MAEPALIGADRGRRDADRADLALTAAAVGEYEWDIVLDEWMVSPRMATLTGLPAGVARASPGQAFYDHVHADDLEGVRRAVSEDLRRHGRYDIRFRFIRPDDGRLVWLNSTGVGIKGGGQGEFVKAVGVVRDISAEKEEAAQREGLVAELDHRVKNVLASVQSLAAQSARRTVSLEAFLKTFFGRLEAMAAAHTLLTATRWRGAEIGHVAAAELGGLAQGQARWEGPDIVLSPRATHALTLALHELGANAVKYGALSTETGRIDVTWRAAPGGGFELVWTERNGPIVTPPTRRGFGSTLLERVTGRELGGTARLDFRPEGLRAVLSAGVSALAVDPDAESVDSAPEATVVEDPESLTGASHGGVMETDIRGVRILIVEDAVLLALELEAGLIECGASVVGTAADLGEATRMLSLDFDAAVLDANLNGASVTPVAEALARRGVPFIFATGYGDANAAPAGFGVPVVRKPYNVRQIAAALVEAASEELEVADYAFPPFPPAAVPIAATGTLFPVRRILCVGRNYAAHRREMGGDERDPPFFFAKPADAIVQGGADVPYPSATTELHHEIELVIAIGGEGADVSPEAGAGLIYGYAVGVDLTRRDLQAQAKAKGQPWEAGKGFDRSAPISPIHRGTPPPPEARLWLAVNGALRQDGRIGDMIWSPAEIVAQASTLWRLSAGDLIFTGTPEGVGPLVTGDRVTGGLDGVGTLEFVISGGDG